MSNSKTTQKMTLVFLNQFSDTSAYKKQMEFQHQTDSKVGWKQVPMSSAFIECISFSKSPD